MKCSVFRSSLKDFTYIYLRTGHDYDDLPDSLREVFGNPGLVMNLELTPKRKLAYADINQVMKNLEEQGYHLQLPPQKDTTGLLELPDKQEEMLFP
jgi:uncharacterized protein YcgL (UPF0745 family)